MEHADRLREHFSQAQQVLDAFLSDPTCMEAVAAAGEAMASSISAGGKVISCGNGGSMCDAMHFAEELTGRYRDDRKALPALSISDPSHLSCVGNDHGFEFVFARFVEALGRPGDVLLAISTSGKSPNVLRAAEAAKEAGMTVVGLDRKTGPCCPLCDVEVSCPVVRLCRPHPKCTSSAFTPSSTTSRRAAPEPSCWFDCMRPPYGASMPCLLPWKCGWTAAFTFSWWGCPTVQSEKANSGSKAPSSTSDSAGPAKASPSTLRQRDCARKVRRMTCRWPSASSRPPNKSRSTALTAFCAWESSRSMALASRSGALAGPGGEQPGWTGAILPYTSAAEAALNPTVTVYPAQHLHEVLDHLSGQAPLPPIRREWAAMVAEHGRSSLAPLAAIRGQPHAIEAMAVAAAGGHNVCMVGPPGAGKTLLAKAMTGLLPPLDISEAMAVNRIHSVASRTDSPQDLLLDRPFRSPHHTISDVALVGGGPIPAPGNQLAHGGAVPRRTPRNAPTRPRGVETATGIPTNGGEPGSGDGGFSSGLQLVAAMNLVRAGATRTIPPDTIGVPAAPTPRRYLDRISGPLLDRMDIHLDIEPVPADQLLPEPEPRAASTPTLAGCPNLANARPSPGTPTPTQPPRQRNARLTKT